MSSLLFYSILQVIPHRSTFVQWTLYLQQKQVLKTAFSSLPLIILLIYSLIVPACSCCTSELLGLITTSKLVQVHLQIVYQNSCQYLEKWMHAQAGRSGVIKVIMFCKYLIHRSSCQCKSCAVPSFLTANQKSLLPLEGAIHLLILLKCTINAW